MAEAFINLSNGFFTDSGVKLVTLNSDDNVIKESGGPFSTKMSYAKRFNPKSQWLGTATE